MLLIRHAETDAIGRCLTGRLRGVHLNDRGREQAARLAALSNTIAIDAIYSSPLERARETAAGLARALRLAVQIDDGLNEVDFGEWTGLTFDVLNARMDWHRFNSSRSDAEVPGGETSPQVQERIVAALTRLAALHRGGVFAVVSHADVIRAAILHVMQTSLDEVHNLTIDPASVSAVELEPAARVLYLNRGVKEVRPSAGSPALASSTRNVHGSRAARLERHLHRK